MRRLCSAAGLAAIVLAVAACASSGSSSSSPAAVPSSASSSAGTMVLFKMIHGSKVLTNSKGFTLYWFVPDASTTSMCTGTCASYWPPVAGPLIAGPGVTGTLGTITRSGGMVQATYDGHPLYTYVADTAPGQTKGNGLVASGGLWHEMTVSGRIVHIHHKKVASSGAAAPASSPAAAPASSPAAAPAPTHSASPKPTHSAAPTPSPSTGGGYGY
jgi:predicted lipoprotein with Yx(FWY)xxD motif